jgi:hypothetical protein
MMKFNTRKPVAMVISMAKEYKQSMLNFYLNVIFLFTESKSKISGC